MTYLRNYAVLNVKDRLARIDGVGDVQLYGAGDYSMRVWVDPQKAAEHGLTASDIVKSIQAQNVEAAAGVVGSSPNVKGIDLQLSVNAEGRLANEEQFGDIVVKTGARGEVVRLRDVARIELGASEYGLRSLLDNKQAVAIPIFQAPGSNALQISDHVRATMAEIKKNMPEGVSYQIVYDPTQFVRSSIEAVIHTLLEAIALVVLVVILFLQTWRASIIPLLAVPVSIVGTFAVMHMFGFSINALSLFGLVLAIGIVVDDAIVVVENVERNIERGLSPKEASRVSMDEVSTALVAIVLVLCAVFVPTLFISGISGAFYKQFAVTIASATIVSLILSLTLSPAMAAMLLRPKAHGAVSGARGWRRALQVAADRFNAAFERLGEAYARLTLALVLRPKRMLAVYAGLIALTVGIFAVTPAGFIPAQDQGYFLAVVQLPPGSSLERTDAAVREVAARILPVKGLRGAVMFAGFHGPSQTQAPNSGAIYFPFNSFAERKAQGVTYAGIMAQARQAMAGYDRAQVLIVPPPTVQGIVPPGGFRLMVEDREGRGYDKLAKTAGGLIAKANQTQGMKQVFTFFDTGTPRVYADIDRRKAALMGVPPERVFETLQDYLGSAFINDFNLLGRTFHVTAQADAPYRNSVADIANLKTRSDSGAMVPIGAVATFHDKAGPYRVVRYNLAPAVEVDGDTAPGFSSGHYLGTMERLADATLPSGYDHEWTGIAYQQKVAGNTGGLVFGLGALFVFLVLAAQYESLALPLSIILIVPMCLLAAMGGVNLRGMDNNLLTQIGLVVLIALAAKNAILIVEFAKQAEERDGMSTVEAAVHAARTRLRPILMTSFAFVLDAVPLVFASGAGAELRQALGTAVFFGMLGVTGFGLLFTPTFYVACRGLSDRLARLRRGRGASAGPTIQPAE